MYGRPLDALQRVPADLLKHLGGQLEILPPTIATLRALYLTRRRSLYEHQRWTMELLGMIRFEPTDTVRLLLALCDVVRAGVGGDHLVTATRKLLYKSRFVIPGTRRLSILVLAAVSSVEHDTVLRIERAIPAQIRNRWLDALSAFANPERKTTLLEYLQEPPAKFSLSTIERQSEKVRGIALLSVGVNELNNTSVDDHIRVAAELSTKRPSDSSDDRSIPELAIHAVRNAIQYPKEYRDVLSNKFSDAQKTFLPLGLQNYLAYTSEWISVGGRRIPQKLEEQTNSKTNSVN